MRATAPTVTAPARTAPTRAQWLVLAAAFLGWMFDGVEMGIFPLVARPALQSMIPPSGSGQDQFVGLWMGYITALVPGGRGGRGIGVRLAGGPPGAGAGHDAKHPDLLAFHRSVLLCARAVGSWGSCASLPPSAWAGNGRWGWRWSWRLGRAGNRALLAGHHRRRVQRGLPADCAGGALL